MNALNPTNKMPRARIDIDVDSRTWESLREWTRQKLDACRTRNDAALSESETAILRGAIQAYKDLLALEINPPPALKVDEAAFFAKPPLQEELKPHDD